MTVAEYINSFVDSIKIFWNEFSIKKWSEQVGGSSAEAIEAAIYFCLSFLTGFIFKRYFKFIFACLVVAIVIIKALEHGNFLMINWDAIKMTLGVTDPVDFNIIFSNMFAWIKAHVLISIATSIGFLIGYKLG